MQASDTFKLIHGDRLPQIETPRLWLRWLEAEDAADLYEVFSDEGAMRYWSSPAWTKQQQATDMITSVRRLFAADALYQWGVARREDDQVIGTCTLGQIDAQNKRAEVGFILNRVQWGKGLMSEAVDALIRFGFGHMGLHRIEADVDPDNLASIRLLERLGFRREGLMRQRWFVNGEWNDSLFLGLLCSDWESRYGRD